MRDDDSYSNTSDNPTFTDVLQASLTRRQFVIGGLGSAALGLLGGCATHPSGSASAPAADGALVGFESVPVSFADNLVVPNGYRASVLYAWGDPVSDGPAFKPDAGNSAAHQALQAGMHHDGMQFFPFSMREPAAKPTARDSEHGLLCMNHEYTDDGLLNSDGYEQITADKVAKSQASHGVSVVEVRKQGDTWQVVRPSKFGRRITVNTPALFAGPAAGSALLKSSLHPDGINTNGTLNNCANGVTPWGTYLTCEENFSFYFANGSGNIPPEQKRYGITEKGLRYSWHDFDPRFDAAANPNECNHFGWVVEIDPFDPASKPIKRTALGRFKHEAAMTVVAPDGRVVVYMGDDERFDYIYKFISRDKFDSRNRSANATLLDHGTLYVARFEAQGKGRWMALVHGENGLDAAAGFAGQAEICVKTRQAADKLGATKMDRPERLAVHPSTNEVYVTLTNNAERGKEGKEGANAANPRVDNIYGHILRWREANADPTSTSFEWDMFVLCGDPAHPDEAKRGTNKGDLFGCPDGLWFDPRGVLWIQTDAFSKEMLNPDWKNIGNNQMLAANPQTGEIRRFLTGPRGCEITGVTMTPDMRTLFVNVQHPGENPTMRSDPAKAKAISSWPDGDAGTRPRSATVVIQKSDGGVIGS